MGRKLKEYLMNFYNRNYYEKFINSLSSGSKSAYRGVLGRFLEELGEQDVVMITPADVLKYTSSKTERAYIRSLLIYIAKNNINDGLNKISKQLLVWLI